MNDVALIGPEVRLALRGDPRLRNLQRFVEQHLDRALSLSDAAEMTGLERTYFSRFFRVLTGWTFSTWIRAVRVERATALLRGGRLRILSVALAVGYNDLTTFERAFKKCIGVSPSVYRLSCFACACATYAVKEKSRASW
jgi:two-component system response regulator YesN